MYKIFALFVLILAPIAVTLVSSFVPATDTTIAPAPAPSSPETVALPPSVPVPAPVFEPSPVAVPGGEPPATAAPTLDPRGIDPTPHGIGGSEVSSDTPALESASVEAPDSSNDDRPDS